MARKLLILWRKQKRPSGQCLNKGPRESGRPQKRKSKLIKPLADRIVVKPAEAEQKTSSGLFIPDNAKEKPMQGKVVAVGPGRKNDKKGGDDVVDADFTMK